MPNKCSLSAVICELNPPHFGHETVLRRAKEAAGAVLCVLSGNYVQRGEPALLDKWARAQIALELGADLVAELPLPWAMSGAERFASGGVFLANALSADFLVFGSEEDDLPRLSAAARTLLSDDFSQNLRSLPEKGEAFASRREKALSHLMGEKAAALLRSPNCILGIEYLKAAILQHAPLSPIVIPRTGAGHDQTAAGTEFHSAGELRALFRAGQDISPLVPLPTAEALQALSAEGRCPASLSRLEHAILSRLRQMSPADFSVLPDLSEGLENRLYAASRKAGSLEELYRLVKTKRYSHARIRRLVMGAFLGLSSVAPAFPPYLRILAMTDTGAQVLRERGASLPICARPADFQKLEKPALSLFEQECRADDLYALAFERPFPCGEDYTRKLIRK